MKSSTLAKEIEAALNSIILNSSKFTKLANLNICSEDDIEDFFKLEREGVCRYFLKN